jgi:hypothetical protein
MSIDRAIARQHADWLSLIEVSGPFLSMPVLLETFAHGLDRKDNDGEVRRRLRLAYDEWADNQAGNRPDPAIHTQWLRFVLEEVLELRPDTILEGQQIPSELRYEARDHGETLRPLMVIRSPFDPRPRLLIQQYPATQHLEKVIADKHWKASPATRMMELLRNTEMRLGLRLGLITNGRNWMLVDAPANETTGYYSWDAEIWLEEPVTLQAFRSLLGMERFFNVPQDETLEALLTKSAQKQQEVTSQLGDQVLRAVEMLVQTLDRLDKDSQRTLLHGIDEKDLYEAALTVMMRLVFLLSAEERGMLLLGDPLYEQNYAVSTMHKQLREQADQQAEEVLSLRFDAWSRLLALFRVVFGGIEYPDLRLPAYGGRLFDPDHYPFLEGRKPGTSWRDVPAAPLLIDNRTVLHLLNALQFLQTRVPGGSVEPRRLSFRGLDIEQIGHVYEGLLDHTAKRTDTTTLGLVGNANTEPEATLDELEQQAHKGEQEHLQLLQECTGRSLVTLRKGLTQPLEKQEERSRLMEACDNKQEIFQRVLPYAGLLRKDTFSNYAIVTPGSIYVTQGSDRRSTGTHYTPRSLTEPIVQHTLDPLVYIGPAEGWPQEQWTLRPAAEILDLKICDMAMGSGAFLVQSCRYLSVKLVEAWENAERALNGNGKLHKPQITPEGVLSQGKPEEELLPSDTEERLALARRLVSERCLYGVDKNPMAVEMAKLSLWLITLAKNRPFTFLDHALRDGDSLLGVNERQLYNWSMDAKPGEITQMVWIRGAMERALATALKLRRQINQLTDHDVRDIQAKERLLKQADEATSVVKLGADMLIGLALSDPKRRNTIQGTLGFEYSVMIKAYEENRNKPATDEGWEASHEAFEKMHIEVDELLKGRKPFHWFLEFPEVFVEKGDKAGFAAIMSNPPFQGGQKITGVLGTDYRDYLVEYLAHNKRGSADLCAYFFLRATSLVRHEGMAALLATNTIAQGDTRDVGLDQITASGWTIPRAIPSRKWPGEASLEVAHIWLKHGQWQGPSFLNDKAVESITSFLTTPGKSQGKPYILSANADKSFQGSIVLGMGFILEPEEAQALIAKDPRNKDVLFPYLNGEDLNSRADQSPSRWVINFHDWLLERAEAYPDCMKIVREKVKPERDLLATQRDASARNSARLWWQFRRKSQPLYFTIADMKRVLVIPRVSKYMICNWEPLGIVYSEATCVIATESDADFSLVQCTFHDNWARANGSSLRNDQRYTPSDCFETFPFPQDKNDLNNIGERYYTHRQSIMLARQEGLTKTYNHFHAPQENNKDIITLRELHREMDEAVAKAYGWDDLKLEHGFHETKQGLRYTISEAARREVLDRLLLLNHQLHEEEVKAGLFEGKGSKRKGKAKGVVKEVGGSGIYRLNEGAGAVEPVDSGDVEQGALFSE